MKLITRPKRAAPDITATLASHREKLERAHRVRNSTRSCGWSTSSASALPSLARPRIRFPRPSTISTRAATAEMGVDVGLEGRACREKAPLLRKAPRQEAHIRLDEDAAHLLRDLRPRGRRRRSPRGRARRTALGGARRIIEFLAVNGETQTKAHARRRSASPRRKANRITRSAIEELQRLMYVARVRAVGEGREDYNYTYDLFVHRYPETVRAAERATSTEAMTALLGALLDLAGGVSETGHEALRLGARSASRTRPRIDVERIKALLRADGLLVHPERRTIGRPSRGYPSAPIVDLRAVRAARERAPVHRLRLRTRQPPHRHTAVQPALRRLMRGAGLAALLVATNAARAADAAKYREALGSSSRCMRTTRTRSPVSPTWFSGR